MPDWHFKARHLINPVRTGNTTGKALTVQETSKVHAGYWGVAKENAFLSFLATMCVCNYTSVSSVSVCVSVCVCLCVCICVIYLL